MLVSELSDNSRKIFEDTLESYKMIRADLIDHSIELSKLNKLYVLLGDEIFTYGIKLEDRKIKIKDPKTRRKYKNLALKLSSLIYHISAIKPYIRPEDINIETLPGIFKDLINVKLSGKIGNVLENYLDDLTWDEKEKIMDGISNLPKQKEENVGKMGKIEKIPIRLPHDLLIEDLKESFSAEEVTTVYRLHPEDSAVRRYHLKDSMSDYKVFIGSLYDAQPLDELIGRCKLNLFYWESTSSDPKVNGPLDLIAPEDRSLEPFYLNEETLTEIVEDYHNRVNHVINLTKRKTYEVLSMANEMVPFSYMTLTGALDKLISTLDKTHIEMTKNKERELELSKLYYVL